MEDYNKEFDGIIDSNFNDPSEDFEMKEFIKWMHHENSLLDDRQLDFYADEQNMVEHLSSKYGISFAEAKRVFNYAEDMYLSDSGGSHNE